MSIYISGESLVISVDSILILLLIVESPSPKEIKGSTAKLWTSVDRCWDVNVDRRSVRMSILLLEAFIYATSCVIELLCNLLLVLWNVLLLHEEVVCSIGCLKDVCNILSRYVQCTSIYCFRVAIWVLENTKFVWSWILVIKFRFFASSGFWFWTDVNRCCMVDVDRF